MTHRLPSRIALGVALLIAAPALAQTPMSAEDFDAYSQGKTFYYGAEGQAYGVEEYMPDRRVRWSFLDGDCKDGRWYEDAGAICFVYEDNIGGPQCWYFFQQDGGISATFRGDDQPTQLYEIRKSSEPMHCTGPEVGV